MVTVSILISIACLGGATHIAVQEIKNYKALKKEAKGHARSTRR